MITFIFLGLLALMIVLIVMGFRIVQQSETMVIERLGKFDRILNSGINIIWPIIDRPRQIMWRYIKEEANGKNIIVKQTVTRIDLRETVYDFPKQSVITKDNVVTEINAILYFQITDPMKAVYEIANLPDAIEKLTQTTLRNVIGEMDLDETLTSRDTINSKLRSVLDDATHKWGVKVNRVELQDINPPHDIRDAMEKQMRAERDKRAKILEAEGTRAQLTLEAEGRKAAEVNRAEGEKQARILRAEGEALAILKMAEAESQSINMISTAVSQSNADPVKYMIAIKYVDALKDMTKGDQTKTIYIPYEATGVLASLGGIRELLDSKNNLV